MVVFFLKKFNFFQPLGFYLLFSTKTPTLQTHDHHKKIVKACQRGNPQAQRQLYNLYVQAMFNVAQRIVGDRTEAEDVVQETFISVFQQITHFKGQASIGAWIKRITINTALNHLRKRKKIVYMETVPAGAPESDDTYQVPYQVADIHHGIKQLPEGCRVVLSLHLIEGYQHKEIAQILGITESTSKSQYHRGKKLLKAILKKNKNASHVI